MNKKALGMATTRKLTEERYKAARINLIFLIGLTVLNLALLFLGSESMMLFSATIPYYAVIIGSFSQNLVYFVVGVCLAVVCIIMYLICWIASKKNPVWLTVAFIMFIIDTLGLVALFILSGDFSGILDLLIHAYALYILLGGVVAAAKLKKMPDDALENAEGAEEQTIEDAMKTAGDDLPSLTSVTYIRMIDPEEKSRILVEAQYMGHHIQYHRAKCTNMLVVDNRVYSEQKMVIETEHYLFGNLEGHTVTVGLDSTSHCIISVDGEVIAKKFRLM